MKERYWLVILVLTVGLFFLLNTTYTIPRGEECLLLLPILLIIVFGYIDSINK